MRRSASESYAGARGVLIYRIIDPGSGFRFDDLPHAAVAHPGESPIAHIQSRASVLASLKMVDHEIWDLAAEPGLQEMSSIEFFLIVLCHAYLLRPKKGGTPHE